MNYAIIRNTKYTTSQLSVVYRHNERKNTNYSNKDINKKLSKVNYSIKECNTTYEKRFKGPGASGMQPRDPCRPWRGTLASGHKPK